MDVYLNISGQYGKPIYMIHCSSTFEGDGSNSPFSGVGIMRTKQELQAIIYVKYI